MLNPKEEQKMRIAVSKTAEFCGVELLSTEYLKEGGSNVLRVTISKDGGVSTQDCEALSRAVSKKLDELDCIKDRYFLEVTSPGTDEYKGVPNLNNLNK